MCEYLNVGRNVGEPEGASSRRLPARHDGPADAQAVGRHSSGQDQEVEAPSLTDQFRVGLVCQIPPITPGLVGVLHLGLRSVRKNEREPTRNFQEDDRKPGAMDFEWSVRVAALKMSTHAGYPE